jgi:hypothetical protein
MADVLDFHLHSRTGSVLRQLNEASRVLDELWREAVDDGRTDEAIDFGEASQGLHRALVVLALHAGGRTEPQGFAVDWG